MGQTKGSAIINIIEFIIDTYGAEALERVKNALVETERNYIFNQNHTRLSWVNHKSVIHFLITTDRVLGMGDFKLLEDANIYSVRKNFTGVNRFILNFTSPGFILNNAGKLWATHFDTGHFKLVHSEEKKAVAHLTDYPDIPLYHEYDDMPYIAELLRMAGCCKIAFAHPKCMARGDDFCLFECTCV